MTGYGQGESPSDVSPSLPVSQILDLCDRIVGEIGRRSHMFGWLRAASDDERWLTVDAYYPSHRLVVTCRDATDADGALYAERAPPCRRLVADAAGRDRAERPRACVEREAERQQPVPAGDREAPDAEVDLRKDGEDERDAE